VTRERAGATKLREAIDAYDVFKDHCDPAELKSLARLAASRDAAKVFERLKLKDDDGTLIVGVWIEASQLFHSFSQRIKEANEFFERMGPLDTAVAQLRYFISTEIKKQSEWRASEQNKVAAMERGLELIADKIKAKRSSVEEMMVHFGITRKIQSKEAAENAVIWYLAQAVRRITGKPHFAEVTDLAQVLLGIVVSQNRVSHIVRYRRQRHDEMMNARTKRLTPIFDEMVADLNERRENERRRRQAKGMQVIAALKQLKPR
jgi:hypothetical protein